MLMDEGMDSGPVLMTSETEITPEDTLESLHDRLAEMGADLLVKVLPLWAYFKVKPVRQDPALVTTAYKIKKSDGLLHWEDATAFSLRKIRAYTPWPSCYTFMPENHRAAGKMLKILAAEACPLSIGETAATPGTILHVSKTGIVVRTVDGALRLLRVQPEGGKPMDVAAWICGHAVEKGMSFVTPPAPAPKPIEAYRRT
jgi:methionyl-tRNA formyltransferase